MSASTVRGILCAEGAVGVIDGNSLGRLLLCEDGILAAMVAKMAEEGGYPVVIRPSGPSKHPILDAVVDGDSFDAAGMTWRILPWWEVRYMADAAIESARRDYGR